MYQGTPDPRARTHRWLRPELSGSSSQRSSFAFVGVPCRSFAYDLRLSTPPRSPAGHLRLEKTHQRERARNKSLQVSKEGGTRRVVPARSPVTLALSSGTTLATDPRVMVSTLKASRWAAAVLTVALVAPIVSASHACPHAARSSMKSCSCEDPPPSGPAASAGMSCCKSKPTIAPLPRLSTEALRVDFSDSVPMFVSHFLVPPLAMNGERSSLSPDGGVQSPPTDIHLLHSVFRI